MSFLDSLNDGARAELEQWVGELVKAEVARRLGDDRAAADHSPYLTVLEAATYLRCSRQRVDDLLSQRRLRRYKDGARTLILRAELEAHVQERP